MELEKYYADVKNDLMVALRKLYAAEIMSKKSYELLKQQIEEITSLARYGPKRGG